MRQDVKSVKNPKWPWKGHRKQKKKKKRQNSLKVRIVAGSNIVDTSAQNLVIHEHMYQKAEISKLTIV
jgi:hypothetical protein